MRLGLGRGGWGYRGAGASAVLALAAGITILLPGLLLRGTFRTDWFVPACDIAAITLLSVAAALGGLDAALRRDSRSLPVVLLAGFGLVAWVAHLASFLGAVPGGYGGDTGPLARLIFGVISLAIPTILALTLLHWARPLDRPLNALVRSALAGLGLGALGVFVALGLAVLLSASGQATLEDVLGVLGLTAVVAGLALLLSGHHGDERIVSGVAAGLVLSGFASIGLIVDGAPHETPIWYATHLLAALPFAALLTGQLSIYDRSVRAERDSEARLRTIFEGSAMGICLIDAQGRLIEVNSRVEEITGYRRRELRGMTFAAILGAQPPTADLSAFAQLRRGQLSQHETDVCVRAKDGEERWLRVIVSRYPASTPGGPYFIAMGHDISEERRYQAELETASQRLATAERIRSGVDLVSELAGSLDLAQIANRFVKRVVAAVDADRCSLFRADGDGMVMEASFDRSGPLPWIGEHFSNDYLNSQPLLRRALVTHEAVLGGRLDLDQVTRGYGDLITRVRHTAAVPLLVGDEVGGLLLLSRVSSRPFTEDDLDVLRLIGGVAALALRNAGLYTGAQEASEAKTLFLNMAAHELRTPLTVILGYISLLLEGSLGPPGENWRPIIELLDAKTRELGSLVDGILIAARLEEGPISLPLERLEVGQMVEQAVRRALPRARLKQSELSIALSGPALVVEAHRDSLERILDNLLNNAIVYSSGPGRVRVTAAGDGGQVVISVDDDGIGIPADMHERIFERLVRIDQPGLGYPPGTGLGLYISRGLAERMEGSLILARSSPGEGSSFELRLPGSTSRRRGRARRQPAAAAAAG